MEKNDPTRSVHDTKRYVTGNLSEEDIQEMKRVQRRNLVIAIVLGALLLVLGFFAGRQIRGDQVEQPSTASVTMCDVFNTDLMGEIERVETWC